MWIRLGCIAGDHGSPFKQWGGWGADGKKRSKKANGRELGGKTFDGMPRLDIAIVA